MLPRWVGIMRLSASTLYTRHRPNPCELRVYLRLHGVPQAAPGPHDMILRDLGKRHEHDHLARLPDGIDLGRGCMGVTPTDNLWDAGPPQEPRLAGS